MCGKLCDSLYFVYFQKHINDMMVTILILTTVAKVHFYNKILTVVRNVSDYIAN